MDNKPIALAAALLTGFAVLGTGLVAVTHVTTRDNIAEQQRQALLDSLNEIVPAQRYDNDLARDTRQLDAPQLVRNGPATAYFARRDGQVVAVVLSAVAPDGYSGKIALLVGIYRDGSVAGVRATRHRETPGLGDAIEVDKSDWIRQFEGRSLGQPARPEWAVKKDGGEFDQLTGATITPRAVIAAVARSLEYFEQNKAQLLVESGANSEEDSP